MPLYTDQCGRSVSITNSPQRIISLVPSQTELLYDLGLDDRVAGITKFCIHPNEWFRSKTRIGGTKTIKMDIIHHLQPDLIIANKEENVREQVEELANKYPVWVSDVNNLEDALEMIAGIGKITSTYEKAEDIARTIRNKFDALTPILQLTAPNSTCYLIWKDPYITVGGNTFIMTCFSTPDSLTYSQR